MVNPLHINKVAVGSTATIRNLRRLGKKRGTIFTFLTDEDREVVMRGAADLEAAEQRIKHLEQRLGEIARGEVFIHY